MILFYTYPDLPPSTLKYPYNSICLLHIIVHLCSCVDFSITIPVLELAFNSISLVYFRTKTEYTESDYPSLSLAAHLCDISFLVRPQPCVFLSFDWPSR